MNGRFEGKGGGECEEEEGGVKDEWKVRREEGG